MIRLKIEAGYSVSSVYVEGQSLLFFCLAPEKWGGHVPPVPTESYAYDCKYNGYIRDYAAFIHENVQ